MSGVVLFLALLGFTSLPAARTRQITFVGCVNRLPDGNLQFGTLPSGELFILGGQKNATVKHVGQLIRVTGEVTSGAHNTVHPTLTVAKVKALAESCASALPTARLESVPGKVGEDLVAVPVTSTIEGDQTTPGFQTETQTVQSPPEEQLAAPAHPDQVAESEAAANANASAVDRTEILPGHALGVAGLAGATSPNASDNTPSVSVPGKSPANPLVVGIRGNELPSLSKSTIKIRVGQTVEWLNESGQTQEIVANPARAKQPSAAALPPGAQPFDSGYVRPDRDYQHRFTVPGVYRYFCELNNYNNPMQVVGEVVVAR